MFMLKILYAIFIFGKVVSCHDMMYRTVQNFDGGKY